MREMFALREELARRCAFCERELREDEQRVVLPMYVQQHDELVREGVAEQRVACVDCAMSFAERVRERRARRAESEARDILAYLRLLKG